MLHALNAPARRRRSIREEGAWGQQAPPLLCRSPGGQMEKEPDVEAGLWAGQDVSHFSEDKVAPPGSSSLLRAI